MITARVFDSETAFSELRVGTEYEAWLLESIYEIVDQPISVENVDHLIYPANGGPPTQHIYGVAHINLGDWRPGFLEVDAPLVFATAFKLLDMLIEWILIHNGKQSTHRFSQKIAAIKKSDIVFPKLIESNKELRERLIALYEQLEPLRGTIIHNRHFRTTGGGLQVSPSKGGYIGTSITISPTDLRHLTVALVSLIRCLDGTWVMNVFHEKRICYSLDQIAHVHGRSQIGQQAPHYSSVRIYTFDNDPLTIYGGPICQDTKRVKNKVQSSFHE